MTIICALRAGAETWIGSDTRATLSGGIFPGAVQKWEVRDSVAVGVTGGTRAMNILGSVLEEWPGQWGEFSIAEFCAKMRTALKAADYPGQSSDESGAPLYRTKFIVATPYDVWDVDEAFGFAAVTPISNFSAPRSGPAPRWWSL